MNLNHDGNRAPTYLNGVVRAAREHLGDLGPAVPELRVRLEEQVLLLLRPRLLLDVRVQLVVPALAALRSLRWCSGGVVGVE